jgi:hypothetical protein
MLPPNGAVNGVALSRAPPCLVPKKPTSGWKQVKLSKNQAVTGSLTRQTSQISPTSPFSLNGLGATNEPRGEYPRERQLLLNVYYSRAYHHSFFSNYYLCGVFKLG